MKTLASAGWKSFQRKSTLAWLEIFRWVQALAFLGCISLALGTVLDWVSIPTLQDSSSPSTWEYYFMWKYSLLYNQVREMRPYWVKLSHNQWLVSSQEICDDRDPGKKVMWQWRAEQSLEWWCYKPQNVQQHPQVEKARKDLLLETSEEMWLYWPLVSLSLLAQSTQKNTVYKEEWFIVSHVFRDLGLCSAASLVSEM